MMTLLNRLFLPMSIVGLAAAAAAAAGYHWAKASVAQAIYRDRLVGLLEDYRLLADQYNQAITPRPVTELLVEQGVVSVLIREGPDEVSRYPTAFNAWDNELFVDYALIDGRLLIRRVFDEHTAPNSEDAVLIDQDLLEVAWDAPGAGYGQAIYRNRMADGRWIISVTANGALGLEKINDSTAVRLIDKPKIESFEPVDELTKDAVERIGFGDVWQYLKD